MKLIKILNEYLEGKYQLTPLDIRILKRIHNEFINSKHQYEKNIILYDIIKDKLHITDLDTISKYIRLFSSNYREDGDYENIKQAVIKHIDYPEEQMALANFLNIPPEFLTKKPYTYYRLKIYENLIDDLQYIIGTEEQADYAVYLYVQEYTDEHYISGWNFNFIKPFIIPNEEWIKEESNNRATMRIQEMDLDDKLEWAVFKYRYNAITKTIEELEKEYDKTQNEDKKIIISREINKNVKLQDEIEAESDKIVFNDIKNEIKDEIEADVINYCNEYYGENDYDELYKKKYITLDFEKFTKRAIDADGRGYFLNSNNDIENNIVYNNKNYCIFNVD